MLRHMEQRPGASLRRWALRGLGGLLLGAGITAAAAGMAHADSGLGVDLAGVRVAVGQDDVRADVGTAARIEITDRTARAAQGDRKVVVRQHRPDAPAHRTPEATPRRTPAPQARGDHDHSDSAARSDRLFGVIKENVERSRRTGGEPVRRLGEQVVPPVAERVVAPVTAPLGAALAPVTAPLARTLGPVTSALEPVTGPLTGVLAPVTAPLSRALAPFTAPLDATLTPVAPAPGTHLTTPGSTPTRSPGAPRPDGAAGVSAGAPAPGAGSPQAGPSLPRTDVARAPVADAGTGPAAGPDHRPDAPGAPAPGGQVGTSGSSSGAAGGGFGPLLADRAGAVLPGLAIVGIAGIRWVIGGPRELPGLPLVSPG